MGGRGRLEGDLTPGRRWERGTDWCRQAPCSSLLYSLRTPNTFPTFCSLKAFSGLICGVQWGAEWRPLFSERLPSWKRLTVAITTLLKGLKLPLCTLNQHWPAFSAFEKLALGKRYTNTLSLLADCQATSSPCRLYFHLNVGFFLHLSPSHLLVLFSPCHMQIFPLADGDGEKSIVLQNTGADELRHCGIFIGGL